MVSLAVVAQVPAYFCSYEINIHYALCLPSPNVKSSFCMNLPVWYVLSDAIYAIYAETPVMIDVTGLHQHKSNVPNFIREVCTNAV